MKPGMYRSWPEAAFFLVPTLMICLIAWCLIIYVWAKIL
jgi:hypothetical protein